MCIFEYDLNYGKFKSSSIFWWSTGINTNFFPDLFRKSSPNPRNSQCIHFWSYHILITSESNDGFGLKFFDPGRVGLAQFFVARVGSAIYGLGLEHFPQKSEIFHFIPFGTKKLLWVGSKSTRVKDGSASFLLRVKSMLGLGLGPSLSESLN